MRHLNIEIKAKATNQEEVGRILTSRQASFKGLDHQIDTYFNVPLGRLKLREGNIENYLVQYNRPNQEGPKQSDVVLYKPSILGVSSLKEALTKSLGVLAVVDKKREIYFIDNVKFHLDAVQDLGTFVEIEAIDKVPSIGRERLLEQCEFYQALFGILPTDLISVSYSDLILAGR
ncbi:class IV adenylate cyclase [Candidatus Pacearchaeota archaeon]|nr:class IV adenylate cyclase [Candidatus Pacearchaeota archaeon]